MINIKDNLKLIIENLNILIKKRSGIDSDIKLVCVTKEASIEQINEAIEFGIVDFGENKVQSAKQKIAGIDSQINWHMIGHLQSGRASEAVRMFDLIQSVDTFEIANTINNEAQKQNKIMNILVQVNTSNEESKFGIDVDTFFKLVQDISTLRHIRILGLMTIAPFSDDPETSRPFFRNLRELKNQIKKESNETIALDVLSMGMSADFEVAIEEGSNMIRLGSLIFKTDTDIVKERFKCLNKN